MLGLDIPQVRDRLMSFEAAVIAAVTMLGFTIFTPLEIGVVVGGTGLLLASRGLALWPLGEPERVRDAALFCAVVLAGCGFLSFLAGEWYEARTWLLVFPLTAGVGYFALRHNVAPLGTRRLITGVLLVMIGAVGATQILVEPPPITDVYHLHISAADALLAGENPYAVATAINTAPTAADGQMVVGYPYPPPDLIAYAGSQILFGDPRWASVIALGALVVMVTRPWSRLDRSQAAAVIALGVVIAVQPVLNILFRKAWTEPVSLPFLMGVGLLWNRSPVGSAILLGLTFGMKQYWIAALPLLLLCSDSFRWKRFWIAGGVAIASVLPAFLVGPGAAWEAMVSALANAPLRTDSLGLAGLGWAFPMWVALVGALGVALWMRGRMETGPGFLVALAATLSVAFLLGSQAFLNYWFLVANMGVAAMAVLVVRHTETAPPGGQLVTAPGSG